ncbi:hypothetical protein C0Q70_08381 [Pomacea canaliculata]|uniref:Uncharacterized protein n=1 Tax=Pomacea canaliculata TaxID=400727 RepID=A0A2T7PHP6_POMCA|nr:hypothetical protein C0Q70_08381 [Pomacea canaliculata]
MHVSNAKFLNPKVHTAPGNGRVACGVSREQESSCNTNNEATKRRSWSAKTEEEMEGKLQFEEKEGEIVVDDDEEEEDEKVE